MYHDEKKKARWQPNIDHYRCLGYGACRTFDASAVKLRETSGADVSTCSTLQDGDHCVDFDCIKYKSQVRNPDRNKIRCKFGVWKEPQMEYCVFCAEGMYKFNQSHCKKCAEGKSLMSGPENDHEECLDCTPGWYQPNEGQPMCKACEPGQYQSRSGQTTCEECGEQEYQTAAGKSACQACQWPLQMCHLVANRDKSVEPAFNIYFVVGPIGALIFLIVIVLMIKSAKIIRRGLTAWKPQTQADAARAKAFVLPKTSHEMVKSMSAFKACEKHFIQRGWSDEDLESIEKHRKHTVQYLGGRVLAATKSQQIQIMQCCLGMDVLYDFR